MSQQADGSHLSPRSALVAGFGPVGRLVAEGLAEAGFAVTVLELNPATVATQKNLGRSILLADARDPEALRRAGLASADTLVLTMPSADDAVAACRAARQVNPTVYINARANFVSQGIAALREGADDVTIEELVTAEAMRDAALRRLAQTAHP